MRMDDPRIAITGLGFFTPLGDTKEALRAALAAGRTGIRPLSRGDFSAMPVAHGGECDLERLPGYGFDPYKLKGFKPYIPMGLAAARNALDDAGLAAGARPYADDRMGAFVSTGINGENAEGLFEGFSLSDAPDGSFDPARFAAEGIDTVHPKWILTSISNNFIFFLTSEFALRGDNNNVACSDLGGAHMLEAAAGAIRCGACDAAVVAGTDGPLTWQTIDDLSKLGLLGNPEDRHAEAMPCHTAAASGALPAEGAACLVLERMESARARGARIYAELAETAAFAEGGEFGPPGPAGVAPRRVVETLLAARGADRSPLLACLNGTASPAWDAAERSGAFPPLLSLHESGVPVRLAAAKPWFGHAFSASFVLDAAVCALALAGELDLCVPHAVEGGGAAALFRTPRKEWGGALVLGQTFGGHAAGALLSRG